MGKKSICWIHGNLKIDAPEVEIRVRRGRKNSSFVMTTVVYNERVVVDNEERFRENNFSEYRTTQPKKDPPWLKLPRKL
jgi:hypothetical protein